MSQLVQYQFSNSLYSFTLDGWFNATEAAARFGKEPFDWLIQRDTVAYIVALAKRSGNSGFVQELNKINKLSSIGSVSIGRLTARMMAAAGGSLALSIPWCKKGLRHDQFTHG